MLGKKVSAGQYSRYWMDQDIFDDGEFGPEDKGTDLARIVRLAAVRRATGNFVSILAGKNVPVAFSSGKQSYTDGKTVVISADDNPEKFDCTVGLALHEGSHILLSDTRFLDAINLILQQLSRRQLPRLQQLVPDLRGLTPPARPGAMWVDHAMDIVLCPELRHMLHEPQDGGGYSSGGWERYNALPYWGMSLKMLEDIHRIANILEDRRIDRWVYRTAVGYRPYYQALYDHYFWTPEVAKNLKFNPEWRELTIDNYCNRLLMMIHPDADPNALPGLAAIVRLIDLPNIDRIAPEHDAVAWVGTFPGPRVAVPAWWEVASYDNLPVAWKLANEVYCHILKYAQMAQKQKSLTQPGQPEEQKQEQDKTAEEQLLEALGQNAKIGDLPNLDGGPMSPAEMEATEPEKDKKGKDGKYNAKKGEKAVKTAKDMQDGKEKKKKLNKPDEAAVNALEQADAKMVDLEGDGVPFGKCMVTRKMTDDLIKQPWFIFGRPGWADEAQKSIAAGKRMGAILFQRLQVRNDPLVTKQTRLPQGGLDRRLLAQLGMNIEAVFQKSRTDQHKPAMLHLTLDASGSMYGRKWSKVRTVAVALAYVGSKMRNVDTVVSIRGGNELPIVSVVYDSRKDRFNRFTHFMSVIGPAGATPEGLCFKATMEMILECADTHDVYFINFSDGEPAFGYNASTKFGVKAKRRNRYSSSAPDQYFTYGGDVAMKHTRTMVQQMRDRGVKVLSYFISEYNDRQGAMRMFRGMYGEDAAFVNVENAAEVIRTLNQRLLSRG